MIEGSTIKVWVVQPHQSDEEFYCAKDEDLLMALKQLQGPCKVAREEMKQSEYCSIPVTESCLKVFGPKRVEADQRSYSQLGDRE